MTYALAPVYFSGSPIVWQNTGLSGFPATYSTGLLSTWLCLDNPASTVILYLGGNFGGLVINVQPTAIAVAMRAGNTLIGGGTFTPAVSLYGVRFNLLISWDSINQKLQVYANNAAVPGTPTWPSPQAIDIDTYESIWGVQGGTCSIADLWASNTAAFVDLSVAANRQKFIYYDLLPADVGSTGQNPTGSTPPIFLHEPIASFNAADFALNLGTGGAYGIISGTLSFPAAGICSLPTSPPNGTIADLWFTPTAAFIDLTVVANRRLFYSAAGGGQNLGSTGAVPTGSQPAAFLTSNGIPGFFAQNNGFGGGFALTGAPLVAGVSNPPGSSQTTTTQNTSPGNGVLGDYLTGNLYAFNPNALTDNGTPRRWLRRWRALPENSEAAKRFSALTIDMTTGIAVPDGTTPYIMLRWSDDFGKTWSAPVIIPLGQAGDTIRQPKANRLGMTRRYGASDRIFEVSSTSIFPVEITAAMLDVS